MTVADEVLPSTPPTRTVAGESRPASGPPGPEDVPPPGAEPTDTIITVVEPVPAVDPVLPEAVGADVDDVAEPVTTEEEVVPDVVAEVVVWVMFSVAVVPVVAVPAVSAAAMLKRSTCVEDIPDASVTRTVTLAAPTSPDLGEPLIVAVPSPLSVKVSQDGKLVALKLSLSPSGSPALRSKLNACPAVAFPG